MIKISLSLKPQKLTDELVAEQTRKFKSDKSKRVWDISEVKNSLMKMTKNKCCYCETMLNEESKYPTVDHFHPKDIYPDEVMQWENLLLCCSRCNNKKSNHDTYLEPIINLAIDNPRDYLYFDNYRYQSVNDCSIGHRTRKVLSLNDTLKAVFPRVKAAEAINEKLERIYDRLEAFNNKSVSDRN